MPPEPERLLQLLEREDHPRVLAAVAHSRAKRDDEARAWADALLGDHD